MPRLRMKDTPNDIEAILAKETRARKKRRREEARTRQSDSMTPPRNPPKPTGGDDRDESAFAPGQAAPVADEVEFAERLADASAQDSGVGFFEDAMYDREMGRHSAAFAYGGAAGVAMGTGAGASSVVGGMDEEEYAEYVRAGMWRRKNKDEAERIEAYEREKRRKAEREEVERDKRRKEEAARIKKLEEKAKRRNKAEEGDARLRYDQAWLALLAPAPATVPPHPTKVTAEATPNPTTAPETIGVRALRFSDFAWPAYPPMAFPPLSWPAPADLTPSALSTFLLSHVPSDKRKAALRSAVLAYHPDRFERLVLRVPEEPPQLRERIRELGLRVSQTLNDLMKAGGSVE